MRGDARITRVATAALAAVALCTCDAPANRPGAASAQAPARPAPPTRFDPASVALEADSPVRRVLAATEPAERLRLAEEAIAAAPDPTALGRLRWVAARNAMRAEQEDAARRHFSLLVAMDHPLSPWARLELAELIGPDGGEEIVTLLADLPGDFPDRERAESITAVALARAGREDEAVAALREIVARTPSHIGAASAGMPLAEILAERQDAAEREEALQLYRRIATRAPGARVGEVAAERAAAVLETLPEERRRALSEIPFEDRFVSAEAFFNAMRHDEAEDAFAELARESSGLDACRARLMQGKALLRMRRRDDGAAVLEETATRCEDLSVRTPARYLAARAHGRRGRHEEAIALYDALVEDEPDDRLADDAVFRSAFSAEALGDEEDHRERMARAANDFPEGDMRGEARFHLAWDARNRAAAATDDAERQALLTEALRILDASITDGPLEHTVDLRGRAAYWRARTLADLDRRDEAAAGHEEIARRYPLSYYAQQALRRLELLDHERAARVRAEMEAEPSEPLTFPLRPELESAAFVRAVELLRVDEPDPAMRELDTAGLLGDDADEEGMWLAAAVLDRAGAHPEASLLARRHLRAFLDDPPVGEARHRWRIAYPRAFAPLIEDAAAAEGVPSSLVRAIAREESAFDPRAVSVAHAYGLIQLIRPTARRFGDELGLPSTPDALKTPEINVRIGTRFIGFLYRRYEDNPAIIPSAYNAGEGASDRWLRQRPELSLDAWIEDIPYDETRRYTRRVLQTWGTYAWLDEGRLPELSARLPTR
jgi:soluble lytic murein transglycosylase